MRLDLFLKISRLVPRRTLAKELCDQKAVFLNGRPAKASSEMATGQILRLRAHGRIREIEVLELPVGQVSKKYAGQLYRLISEQTEEPNIF